MKRRVVLGVGGGPQRRSGAPADAAGALDRLRDGLRCFGDGERALRHAGGDAIETPRARESGHFVAGTIAPAPKRVEHGLECAAMFGVIGKQPLVVELDVHLEFARGRRGAAQPARPATGTAGGPKGGRRGRESRLGPDPQSAFEAARGHAQIVDGLGIVAGADARPGRRQLRRQPEQVLALRRERRRGSRGRPSSRPGGVHQGVMAVGRCCASSAETRSHRSSDRSSTLRVASSVWNAYSCESRSNSWISRRW